MRIDATEEQIQAAFVEYVAMRYPDYLGDVIKISNEGKRSPVEGAKHKRLGLRKGASDMFIAIPATSSDGEPIGGLWIEFKTAGGRIMPEQKSFVERMLSRGYNASIVRSIDEAIEVFENHIEQTHDR